MSKLRWIPLDVADFVSDTMHLSGAQTGAYFLLICHYWRHGGLPKDDVELARIARMSAHQWRQSHSVILAFFSADLRHKRIDEELAKAKNISEKRKENGSAGGTAKALKNKDRALANATDLPEQNSTPLPLPVPRETSVSLSPVSEAIASSPVSACADQATAEVFHLEEHRPPSRKQSRKAADAELLDGISDIWNAFAHRHGCPTIRGLTDKRAVACRRRVEYLIGFTQADTPQDAFRILLERCARSFFVRGAPRKPLEFDQLLREEFVTRMLEGSFDYREQRKEFGR